MTWNIRALILVSSLAFLAACILADSTDHTLYLRSHGAVQIPVGAHGWQDKPLFATQARDDNEAQQILFVHLQSPMASGVDEAIDRLDGVRLISYLPQSTYLVHAENNRAIKLLTSFPGVAWVGHYRNEYRVDPAAWSHHLVEPVNENHAVIRANIVPGCFSQSQLVESVKSWLNEWHSRGDPTVSTQSQGNAAATAKTARIHAMADDLAQFEVDGSALVDFIHFLKNKEHVLWIEPVFKLHTMNSEATGITQTGTPGNTLIWDKGIRGQGQLVAVGDSGVDMGNCLFNDPSHTTPYCSDCQIFDVYSSDGEVLPFGSCTFASSACKTLSAHRKVAAYWNFADTSDNLQIGHGTHVCGTVAGSTGDPVVGQYNGTAPEARLVFSDLNDQYLLGSAGSIVTPPNLETQYFPFAYQLGARIHSNSWGGGHSYTSNALQIDSFVSKNRDMLVVFAAGNDGSSGYNSIGSEAQNKNGIAIGASRTTYNHYVGIGVNATASAAYLFAKSIVCNSTYWNQVNNALKNGNLIYSPCRAVQIIYGVNTPCSTQVSQFCPLFNSPSACDTIANAPDTDINYALFVVLEILGSICSIDALVADAPDSNVVGPTNMATFSSRGPTGDGRIKPDIAAPGDTLVSARANNVQSAGFCGTDMYQPDYALRGESGTSMATPAVAGSAALVRQYFLEGFGLCGQKSTTVAPTYVSAALVKATLIQSSIPLTSNFLWNSSSTVRQLTTSGNDIYIQGHGRIQLSNALRFSGSAFTLKYIDYNAGSFPNYVGFMTGDAAFYVFNVPANTRPLRITLVWTDAPGSLASAKQLVNNLDLILHDPNGNVIYGNGQYSLSNSAKDTVNNVEVIHINTPVVGQYNLTVYAESINVGSQDFALMLTYAGPAFNPATDPLCLGQTNIPGFNISIQNHPSSNAFGLGANMALICVLVLLVQAILAMD